MIQTYFIQIIPLFEIAYELTSKQVSTFLFIFLQLIK